MTDERWARVKALFQAVVERPVAERDAFLADAAADDRALHDEVKSLIASDEAKVSVLDRSVIPGGNLFSDSLTSPPASIDQEVRAVNRELQQVGPYEVVGLLGIGGMGAVYRTRDPKLNRDVALKVLSTEFSLDPDRLARFRREAQVLAALNHPNIAAIYAVEESTNIQALVLELVEGPTLAERMALGPIPLAHCLSIAKQIATALEAAHEQGIIHRDLKPSNIKLRSDGVAKVLDFGLAKTLGTDSRIGDAATRDGIILGTAAYMPPEQAKGQPVDKRADVWAFGCVLFEMLAARPAFRGDTFTELLAAVIKDDPDWSGIPAEVPEGVRTLVRRCLRKDPRQRLQAVADARIEIEDAETAPRAGNGVRANRLGSAERVGWILAVTGLTMLAAGALTRGPGSDVGSPETRLEITAAATTDPASIAISPDGQKVVFSAADASGQPQLWLRLLTDVASRALASTEGGRYPFWSPDSRSIGFFANGRLKRVDLDGASVREIADAPLGLGGTWSTGDTIVYSPNWVGPLLRVAANGGAAAEVTRLTPEQSGHRFPQFLPDNRHFLFESIESGGISGVVYVGDVSGGAAKKLIESGASAAYDHTGHVLFGRGGPAATTLVAQKFDSRTLALVGNPFRIAETISSGLDPASAALSVSAAGPIAYRSDSGARRQLVWFDRSGTLISRLGNADAITLNPALSPDGRYVALRRSLGENTDIWLVDTKTGLPSRLTASAGLHNFPVWSPDSRYVTFTANPHRTGVNDFYRKAIDGTGSEDLVLATQQNKGLSDWSADGRFLLYRIVNPETGNDIWAVSLADRQEWPVVQTTFDERDGQFSPDGRWIAYQSNETGSFEIWLRSFPNPGTRIRISNNGGTQVRWRRDGRELFYIAPDGRLMGVPIAPGPDGQTLEASGPVALFATQIGGAWQGNNRHQYMVAPDGQRFLMNTVTPEATSTITIIQNWKGRPN